MRFSKCVKAPEANTRIHTEIGALKLRWPFKRVELNFADRHRIVVCQGHTDFERRLARRIGELERCVTALRQDRIANHAIRRKTENDEVFWDELHDLQRAIERRMGECLVAQVANNRLCLGVMINWTRKIDPK